MDPPYTQLIANLINQGRQVPSRYGGTCEKTAVTVATRAGVHPRRPKLNSKIGLLEGLFLVGGTYSQEAVEAVAPKADLSLFTERGAYGPRIEGQLEDLIRGIERDPSSRQHVLHISNCADLYTSDMPCTLALQFLVRAGMVHCFAFMRSSDVIKGLPTDLVQFGILTQVVAYCFDYVPGLVHVMAASHHLYNNDLEGRMPADDAEGQYSIQPMFIGTPLRRFVDFNWWANDAVNAAPWTATGGLPRGVRWDAVPNKSG